MYVERIRTGDELGYTIKHCIACGRELTATEPCDFYWIDHLPKYIRLAIYCKDCGSRIKGEKGIHKMYELDLYALPPEEMAYAVEMVKSFSSK